MREGQIFFFFQRHTQNKHQEQQNGNKDRYRGMRGKVSDYKIFNNTLLPYTHTHIYNTHTHTHTHTRVHTDAYFCIFIEKVPIQKFPHWRRLFLFFTHTNTLHTPHYQENNISFYTCVSVCQCEFM